MINKLIIGQKLVELETDIVYSAIELRYSGDLYIENLLPSDYIVSKGNGKVLIIRFNIREEILTKLFNYNGYCNLKSGYLLDKNNDKHGLIISKPAIVTWNTMNKKTFLDDTSRTQVWESLTTDYELMENNFRNDYKKIHKITKIADNEGRTITTKRETGTKLSYLAKKDKNLSTLESLSIKYKPKQKTIKKAPKRIKGGY